METVTRTKLTPEERIQRRREAQQRYREKKKAGKTVPEPTPVVDPEEKKMRRKETQKRYIAKKYPERQPRKILTPEERIENRKVINQRYKEKKRKEREAEKKAKEPPVDPVQKKRDQARQSYLKRKEEIQAKRQEKHVCDVCFGLFTTNHRATHMKTARHLRAVAAAATPKTEGS